MVVLGSSVDVVASVLAEMSTVSTEFDDAKVPTSVCEEVFGSSEEMVYGFVVVDCSNTQGYWTVLVDEVVEVLFIDTARYMTIQITSSELISLQTAFFIMTVFFYDVS